MIAFAWYLRAVLAFLLGARVESCPDGWSAMAAREDGTFACLAPVPVGICDTVHGCADTRPLDELHGWLRCGAGERAILVEDGRSVRCARSAP